MKLHYCSFKKLQRRAKSMDRRNPNSHSIRRDSVYKTSEQIYREDQRVSLSHNPQKRASKSIGPSVVDYTKPKPMFIKNYVTVSGRPKHIIYHKYREVDRAKWTGGHFSMHCSPGHEAC